MSKNKINYDVPNPASDARDDAGNTINGGGIDKNIKNLSIGKKLFNSKNPNLAKSKKSDLTKAKNLDFAKVNSFRTKFFISQVKETFIHP